MRYLITGGCGFLGSNISAALLEQGHMVVAFDNLFRTGSTLNKTWLEKHNSFTFRHGDIRNYQDIRQVVQEIKPDCIFHLAGQVAMTTSIERPLYDFQTNALGTLNLLESIREIVPQCTLVYSSTNKVYGDLEHLQYQESSTRFTPLGFEAGFKENLGLDFQSPYGCSKGAADQYILDYYRIYDLKGVVLRHSSMYGHRQYSTYDQGWVGWFCEQALRQVKGDPAPFTIAGNGKQVRDLLHCDDAVNLYIQAHYHIDKICGQAFNIGGGIGNSLSILELINFLEIELKHSLSWQHIEARVSDQKFFVSNNTKIYDAIQWRPQINKEEGIRKILSWIKDHT